MSATINVTTRENRQSKVFTNFWLVSLAVIVGLTILSTAMLVGWPVISYLATKFTG